MLLPLMSRAGSSTGPCIQSPQFTEHAVCVRDEGAVPALPGVPTQWEDEGKHEGKARGHADL